MNSKVSSILFSLFFLSSLYAKETKHLFVISGVVVSSGNSKKIENFIKMIVDKSTYEIKPYYVQSYEHLSQTLADYPDAFVMKDKIFDPFFTTKLGLAKIREY